MDAKLACSVVDDVVDSIIFNRKSNEVMHEDVAAVMQGLNIDPMRERKVGDTLDSIVENMVAAQEWIDQADAFRTDPYKAVVDYFGYRASASFNEHEYIDDAERQAVPYLRAAEQGYKLLIGFAGK